MVDNILKKGVNPNGTSAKNAVAGTMAGTELAYLQINVADNSDISTCAIPLEMPFF